MGLTGVLACLYSNSQLRNAFVIGIAAPSILLNISASVQKPKETLPTIPSIPIQSGKPNARLEGLPQGWKTFFGPATAEAQALPASSEAKIGQVQVTIIVPEATKAWRAATLKGSTVKILDAKGVTPLAMTVPPSQNFAFSLPPGTYTLVFDGPWYQSPAAPVTIAQDRMNEVTLQLQAKPTSTMKWSQFLSGITQRFEHVADLRGTTTAYGGSQPAGVIE